MKNLTSPLMPEIFNNAIPKKYLDNNFQKIFEFYILNVPNSNVSNKSIDITKIWGEKVWKNMKLRAELMKVGDFKENINYFKAQRLNEMNNIAAKAHLDKIPALKKLKNNIIFYNQKNEFISIFFYIRCAFAHVRFTIKEVNNEKFYILETGNKGKKQEIIVKARMIIKEETLLKWIDIILSGNKTKEKKKEKVLV